MRFGCLTPCFTPAYEVLITPMLLRLTRPCTTRSWPCMCRLVSSFIILPGECLLADAAMKWLVTRMLPQVARKALFLVECHGAQVAGVWSLARMNAHVFGQATLARKHFSTVAAIVRSPVHWLSHPGSWGVAVQVMLQTTASLTWYLRKWARLERCGEEDCDQEKIMPLEPNHSPADSLCRWRFAVSKLLFLMYYTMNQKFYITLEVYWLCVCVFLL